MPPPSRHRLLTPLTLDNRDDSAESGHFIPLKIRRKLAVCSLVLPPLTIWCKELGLPRQLDPIGPIIVFLAASTYLLDTFRANRSQRRQRLRRSAGLCIQCAYDLRGLNSRVCPECGMAFAPYPQTVLREKKGD